VLNDPSSVRMQGSFLIKNHLEANFESYLTMMRRRRQFNANGIITQNSQMNQREELTSPSPLEKKKTFMRQGTLGASKPERTENLITQGMLPT
jgi:hypothetical protein